MLQRLRTHLPSRGRRLDPWCGKIPPAEGTEPAVQGPRVRAGEPAWGSAPTPLGVSPKLLTRLSAH